MYLIYYFWFFISAVTVMFVSVIIALLTQLLLGLVLLGNLCLSHKVPISWERFITFNCSRLALKFSTF